MGNAKSIFQVVSRFNTEYKCMQHLERIRWPKGVICLRCRSKRIMRFRADGKTGKERSLYECVDCRYQYSVTAGTIFHDSHLPLVKWFLAIYLICSAKKGVSALQLQRELEIGSYKTAWYMAHRIRLAMRDDPQFCRKFAGIVEVDETYIGGRRAGRRGRGAANKVPVVGIKERASGKVRLQAMSDLRATSLARFIRLYAKRGAEVHTDELSSYNWLDRSEFSHESVNHSETYVRGNVHVNGIETIWSLFKRGIHGAFHHVSAKYLPLYLDEFAFRINHREHDNLLDAVLTTTG